MESIVKDAVVELQSDDVALADKMNDGRKRIVSELKKIIVGQDDVVGQVLLTLFVGGNSLIVGVPGPGQDAADPHARQGASSSSSTASSSRPT